MLDALIFKGTEDSPQISLDPGNNIFEIKGRSLPENSTKFYNPIIDWISEYVKNPNILTHIICHIDYLNSASAKKIYEIFALLSAIKKTGNDLKITWYYEEGDRLIENKGKEFNSIPNIHLEILACRKN